MSQLKVLIAGEYSGVIRSAFQAVGCDAWSCDFWSSLAGGKHIQGDWNNIMNDGWDLGIFHPTCTYMCLSGVTHLYNKKKEFGINKDRWGNMAHDAWEFWNLLRTCPINKICIENPIMHGYAKLIVDKKYSQIIQPYRFGADVSKATCLWLKNLPNLENTSYVKPRVEFYKGKHVWRWSNQALSGADRTPPGKGEERRLERAMTHPGVAKAMAEQWGKS